MSAGTAKRSPRNAAARRVAPALVLVAFGLGGALSGAAGMAGCGGGGGAVAGGVLTIAGVFSGWVTLDPGGNSETVTAWSLTAGEGLLKSNDPYILVALGAAAVVLGLLAGGTLAAMLPVLDGHATWREIGARARDISDISDTGSPPFKR